MFDEYYEAKAELSLKGKECNRLFDCIDLLQTEIDFEQWHYDVAEMGKPTAILESNPDYPDNISIPSPS
jgi:hypothetical protein